jgi:hypothetical protein
MELQNGLKEVKELGLGRQGKQEENGENLKCNETDGD